MGKVYKLRVAGLERDLPICRVSEDLSIAGFVIFGDVELTRSCAAALLEKAPEFDLMAAPEAKAIPLIYEMARQKGVNDYILARKKPKAYMEKVFKTDYESITTRGVQSLYLDSKDAEKMRGKRILIIDDVISSGESLAAMEKLVNEAGGIIAGKMAVLAEGKASERKDIIFLEPLPLFNGNGEQI